MGDPVRRPGKRKRKARALSRWLALRSPAASRNYGREWTTRTALRWKGCLEPPLLLVVESFRGEHQDITR